MDYISREAVVEYIRTAANECSTAFDEESEKGALYAEAYESMADEILYIPAADVEPVRRWIPCSERLPDLIPCKAGTAYSEKVIVWTTERKAMLCVYDGKDWFVPNGFWEVLGKDVTHWMPLPEPPEEKHERQDG